MSLEEEGVSRSRPFVKKRRVRSESVKRGESIRASEGHPPGGGANGQCAKS